eukprot:gnl/TRDRNA2_/TRDRNA2_84755_c1_seq1.p1 gnl/TRDRNA2_/TRDRNA2_84755_c1~~gnl/TRDRNA2_/TRDRNA2_84755_c1_seq1.p1  ORF type:complete len:467 (+),score=32.70 gnl/TRDRNA2_/TRDRNA2_84755_c1_seq1:341-1741(+)
MLLRVSCMSSFFFQMLSYSLVIPDSLDVSKSLQAGSMYSGVLISANQGARCIGSLLMSSFLAWRPKLWRMHGRYVLLVTVMFGLMGASVYCASSFAVQHLAFHPDSVFAGPNLLAVLRVLLVFARCLDGIGQGLSAQFLLVCFTHFFASEERMLWTTNFSLVIILGTGLGPVLSSVMECLYPAEGIGTGNGRFLGGAGIAYLGNILASLGVVLFCYPSHAAMASIPDFEPRQESAEAIASRWTLLSLTRSSESGDWSRIALQCGGVLCSCLRWFMFSGLEAATAFLLQDGYSWNKFSIGLAFGACMFLPSLPLASLYRCFKKCLSTTAWIRVLFFVSILASIFLFKGVLPAGDNSDSKSLFTVDTVLLLGANAMIFPTLFLSDSLVTGLMLQSQHLLPEGTWFDANHVMLYRNILNNGVGRTLGSPVARMTIDSGGQNAYALQQLLCAVVFLYLFEVTMKPNIKSE